MNGLFLSFFPHVNDSIPNNIIRLKTLTHSLSQPHMKKVAASSRLSTRSLPKHFRTSHNSIQGQRSTSHGTGSWSWSVGAWRGGFSGAGAGHQQRTICLSTSPAGLSDSTTSLSALAVFAFSFFQYLAAALAFRFDILCRQTLKKRSRWKYLDLGCRCRTFFVP